jgi:hypothetical protein
MAGTTRTNLAQTAVNAAAQIVAAEGGDLARFDEVSKHILDRLTAVFTKDDQAQKQANSTGGGFRKSGGGSGSKVPPGEVKFKGGKFPGKTVAEVYNMSASEAFDSHDYKDRDGNPQAGRNYIQWMSTNDGYMGDMTRKYLESLKNGATPTPAAEGAASGPAEAASTAPAAKEEEFTFPGGDAGVPQ